MRRRTPGRYVKKCRLQPVKIILYFQGEEYYIIKEELEMKQSLTPKQVRFIRSAWKRRTMDQAALAIMHNVSQPTISNVVTRKVYKKVA